MNNSKMEALTRCYGGGGAGKIKPPIPPTPTKAAENIAKSKVLDRSRRARGFGSTVIGSYDVPQPPTVMKSLLGR